MKFVPNALTISRIVVTPILLVLLFWDTLVGQGSALVLFILAAISDYFDGKLARTYGVPTRLGQFLDPFADKVRRATELARERRPDLRIEGPIQYDAAVDAGVARTKLPESEVAGRATVFIFPDLNTGNNTYKAVQRSAGAVAIGPVLQGLKKPVNDLSRGCTVPDILNTVAVTAIQAQTRRGSA